MRRARKKSLQIGLVVTGDAERRGLPDALIRWLAEQDVQAEVPDRFIKKVHGFTTLQLTPAIEIAARQPAPPPRSDISAFVATLIAMVTQRDRPDWVLGLDDVESNRGNERLIMLIVQRALAANFQTLPPTQHDRDLLRQRASVHLAVPMIESWLFPDSAAVARAGAISHGNWDSHSDAEQFQVADENYQIWHDELWPRSPMPAAAHPKRYLQFLGLDRDRQMESATSEALRLLNWQRVPQSSPRMAYLHALLADLADVASLDYGPTVPDSAATRRPHSPLILRNW